MTTPRPRILVTDDEQHQLDTVCRGLLLYGYDCQGVLSVAAALDALKREDGAGFDLVLTDLTMPGRSGLELIERVRAAWPDLPIVVITGLAATAELGIVREQQIPLLSKPFSPDTLDATIRRALASAKVNTTKSEGKR
jgi:DNA-binding response OmpR family regulator